MKKGKSISFVIIVKDEEKFIKQCVESVLNIADEIVIVDTGSTDNTISIIKDFICEKIKLFYYPWSEDFSDVRNFAKQKINNDWVFYLDADEVITSSPEEILHTTNNINDEVVAYCPIIYDLAIKKTLKGIPRIFNTEFNFEWFGYVHEELRHNSVPAITRDLNIKISHYGYSQEVIIEKNKIERNTQLLEKNINMEPQNLRWRYFKIRDSLELWSVEQTKTEILNNINDFKINEEYHNEYYSLLIFLIQITIFSDEFDNNLLEELEIIKPNNSDRVFFLYLKELIEMDKKKDNLLIKISNYKDNYTHNNYSFLNASHTHLDFLAILISTIKNKKRLNDEFRSTLNEIYSNDYILYMFNIERD